VPRNACDNDCDGKVEKTWSLANTAPLSNVTTTPPPSSSLCATRTAPSFRTMVTPLPGCDKSSSNATVNCSNPVYTQQQHNRHNRHNRHNTTTEQQTQHSQRVKNVGTKTASGTNEHKQQRNSEATATSTVPPVSMSTHRV
jgi:hypothetical protein